MYESHFGLTRRPFLSTPDPDCVAGGDSVENALAGLTLCLESGQGFGILSAPAGTGKTLLCRKLVSDSTDRFAAVFLANSHFPTRRSLLQAILYELGQPYIRMAEQELRLELQTAAQNVRPEKQAVLLVIDEAHLLSNQLLEELRTASNLNLDGTPLFHIILSGQLELEENLIRPGLEALNQRIGCQVTLESLTRDESAAYIAHRLKWAGAEINDVFRPEAVQVICHAADGLPRCLNQLCDHSLLLSYVADERPVSEATVREALEDLKQLPLHWNEPTPVSSPLEQLRADAAEIGSAVDGADVELPSTVFESAPVMEEFPGSNIDETADANLSERDGVLEVGVIEVGDSSSLEVGEPLTKATAESAYEDSVIAESSSGVFEIGGSDIAEYADAAESADSSQIDMDIPLVEIEDPQDDMVIDAPVIAFHRQSIADDGRGFEEELVVDRYAMLDAGVSATEQADSSSGGIVGDATLKSTDVVTRAPIEHSEAREDVVQFELDADSTQSPERIIDEIEPLINEALNDDRDVDDAETVASIADTSGSLPTSSDDDDWAGLTTDENEPAVGWIGGDVPPRVIDVAEYDIVQPDVAPTDIVSSDDRGAGSIDAAERKPQGRYAHLFSKLRRQQRRSA